MPRAKSIYISTLKGQYSAAVDKEDLVDAKKGTGYGQLCSLLIDRDGKGDSRYIGSGLKLIDTTTYGYVLTSTTWRCNDGNTYTLLYCRSAAGACSLVYVKNEAWATITQPAAAQWYDDQDTPVVLASIPFMPPQTVPSFAQDANGNLFVALGVSGVFRIEARAGVLWFYRTHIPLTSFIMMDSARSWCCPADLPDKAWSAIGDVTRYTPKPAEIAADPPTYGINLHAQFAFFGVTGSQVVGDTVWGRAKITWTRDGMFAIFGTGVDGQTQFANLGEYGLMGFRSYTIYNDNLYWFSTYQGGTYLGATFASMIQNDTRYVQRVAIGNNYAITIFDAGYEIQDVLEAAAKMTTKVQAVSWGEYQDWKNIPSTQRAGCDIDLDPGSVSLGDPANKITYTPTVSISRNFNGWASIAFDGTYGAGGLNDADPVYPAGSYTDNTKYCLIHVLLNGSTWRPDAATFDYNIYDDRGNRLNMGGAPAKINDRALAWQDIPFDAAVTTSALILRGGGNADYLYAPQIITYDLRIDFGASRTISGIAIYDLVRTFLNGTSLQVKIGEIELHGVNASSATIYTEACTATGKGVLTGLTIDSARDLGVFFSRFVGNGNDYLDDITIQIRCGTAALAAYDTTSPANTWTNWYTLTDREKKRGKALNELLFKTSGAALVASHTGLLYVQAQVTLAINQQGNSPKLDYMVFTAVTGDNSLSTFPADNYDDWQFVSFMKAATSTGNDVECARSIMGAWSVIYGKENTAYLTLADKTVMVFAGFAGALQYAGRTAYYGVSNAIRAILGRFLTPDINGQIQGGRLSVAIEDYAPVTPDSFYSAMTTGTGWVDQMTTKNIYTGAAHNFGDSLSFDLVTDRTARYFLKITDGVNVGYSFADAVSSANKQRVTFDLTTAGAARNAATSIEFGICDDSGVAWAYTGDPAVSATAPLYGLRSLLYGTTGYLTADSCGAVSLGTKMMTYKFSFKPNSQNQQFFAGVQDGTAYLVFYYNSEQFILKLVNSVGTAIGMYKVAYGTASAVKYDCVITRPLANGHSGDLTLTINGVRQTLTVVTSLYDVDVVASRKWSVLFDALSLGTQNGIKMDNISLELDGVVIFNNTFENAATINIIAGSFSYVSPRLEIVAIKDGTENKRYNSDAAITDIQVLPRNQSLQGGQNSRASRVAVDVRSYSGFRLHRIEFDGTDQSYS